MALRVLLADESATIKKVIQLALQDFGVEVKSVPVGIDVLPVAKSFRPDLVFADVLLTKRNGYEVCADIKDDSELETVPVVLMWSGFMELDQGKVLSCRVDRSLEKPFDPEQLRTLVKELVPRLQTNLISSYLQFPDRPNFVEDKQSQAAVEDKHSQATVEDNADPRLVENPSADYAEADRVAVEEARAHADLFSNDEADAEEFKHVPLPRRREPGAAAREFGSQSDRGFGSQSDYGFGSQGDHGFGSQSDRDDWSQADLAKFRVGSAGANDEIPLPEIDQDVNDSAVVWSSTGEEVSLHSFDRISDNEKSGLSRIGQRSAPTASPAPITSAASAATLNEGSHSRIHLGTQTGIPTRSEDAALDLPQLDFERAEQILREQSRDVLETIAWRILPDVVERVVREELQKLLKDAERLDEV